MDDDAFVQTLRDFYDLRGVHVLLASIAAASAFDDIETGLQHLELAIGMAPAPPTLWRALREYHAARRECLEVHAQLKAVHTRLHRARLELAQFARQHP
jgi:DNA-binding SARP family transcriptional activator